MKSQVVKMLEAAASDASGEKMLREQFEEEAEFQRENYKGMTLAECERYIDEAKASFAEMNEDCDDEDSSDDE